MGKIKRKIRPKDPKKITTNNPNHIDKLSKENREIMKLLNSYKN